MRVKLTTARRLAKATGSSVSPEDATLTLTSEQLAEAVAELETSIWSQDYALWITERCGESLWSKQREICDAVLRYRKTAVRSCHETGKSFLVARIAAAWICNHPAGEAFVVTSAPSARQVRSILWREIGRVHAKAGLPGRTNQTSWFLDMPAGNEELVAFGMKPDDMDPTAFQGIHAKYVLVLFDEGCGMPGLLYEAAESLIANDNGRFVVIGNPDDPSTEFAKVCAPGSGWHVIGISAFDSPNFTGEPMPEDVLQQLIGRIYVEEKRKKQASSWVWTPDGTRVVPPPGGKLEDTHPFWQSKVLGQFPVQNEAGSLIPLSWIRQAQERTLEPSYPNELGLDVGASEGGDPSCCGHRRGSVFRVLYEERQPDTMKTTGKLIHYLKNPTIGAQLAKVDYIGVGRGVVDRCKEQSLPVWPISVSEASTVTSCMRCKHEWDQRTLPRESCPKCGGTVTQKVYANLLSQLWWSLRERFEIGDIDLDPEDEDLAGELITLRWEPNSKGQTQVRYGDGPSPNRADALLMAFAPVPLPTTHAGLPSGVGEDRSYWSGPQ